MTFHPILSRNRALLILESRIFAMAFQVFMSFDLHDASEEDYTRVLESWKLMSMNQVFSSGFFLHEVVG